MPDYVSDLERHNTALDRIKRSVADYRGLQHAAEEKPDHFHALDTPTTPFDKTLVPPSRPAVCDEDRSAIPETKCLRPTLRLRAESSHSSIDHSHPDPKSVQQSRIDCHDFKENTKELESLTRQRTPRSINDDTHADDESAALPKSDSSELTHAITESLLSEMEPLTRQRTPHFVYQDGPVKAWFTGLPGAWEEAPAPPSPTWLAELPVRTKCRPSSSTMAVPSEPTCFREDESTPLTFPDYDQVCSGTHTSISGVMHPQNYTIQEESSSSDTNASVRADSSYAVSMYSDTSEYVPWPGMPSVAGNDAAGPPGPGSVAAVRITTPDCAPRYEVFQNPGYASTDRASHGHSTSAASTPTEQSRGEEWDWITALCPILAALEVTDEVGSPLPDHCPSDSDGSTHDGPLVAHLYERVRSGPSNGIKRAVDLTGAFGRSTIRHRSDSEHVECSADNLRTAHSSMMKEKGHCSPDTGAAKVAARRLAVMSITNRKEAPTHPLLDDASWCAKNLGGRSGDSGRQLSSSRKQILAELAELRQGALSPLVSGEGNRFSVLRNCSLGSTHF
ncbi:hypothetical protein LTR36_000756 [Oleoguttula mirabilis]|uniref:Uncharacterized protein n=1 Tax=Oleoguttula mirabilis TaxID=1507867 RepID=A0AAV9JRG3_9PEZI|nr:hypothetical protein LTR36_000756 [Oleoguttula mirabilis]